jgi:aryl-alcohol dehydrogenase-like predicted oxidoreductase
VTPAQLALAWVLSRGDQIVPIPGTRQVARLEENAAAAELRLTPAELAAIDAASAQGAFAGERYEARGMATVNG